MKGSDMETWKQDFVDLCQTIGASVPCWTQGAGGNVSFKQNDSLHIKASGFRLDEVDGARGIVSLPLASSTAAFRRMVANPEGAEAEYSNWLKLNSRSNHPRERASMESSFHALLPSAWVIHFHSLASILMCFQLQNGRRLPNTRGHQLCKIKNVLPGLSLSREFLRVLDKSIFLLEHHGVVLQSDSLLVLEDWKKLESAFLQDFGYSALSAWYQQPLARMLLRKRIFPFRVIFPDAAVFESEVRRSESQFLGAVRSAEDSDPVARVSGRFKGKTRDAFEIWFATQLLLQSEPDFPDWSSELSQQVQQLPTEAFRKQKV